MRIGNLSDAIYETKSTERVILVGIGENCEKTLEELKELCRTAQLEVVAVYTQRSAQDSKYYCGKGKAEEIKLAVDNFDADAVIADDELTPSQVSSMEDMFGVKVLDRTAVILDIFASRAKSREGKLQVELAQQKYLYSRLAGSRTELSRLGGGIGTRGPGEKKLETDRRHIRSRMEELERDLEDVKRHRELLRGSRKANGFKTVALMGYTNAGKSTLLTALTGSPTYSENILFATLDTLTRSMENDVGMNILVSDTVGFIDKLPHKLIDAFRSTLEESIEADLLLHVIDASSEDQEKQTDVADGVLEELCAVQKRIYVYNKIDALEAIPLYTKHPCCFVSAKTGEGIDTLKKAITDALGDGIKRVTLSVPYDRGDIMSRLYKRANVISVSHEATSIVTADIEADELYIYKAFITDNKDGDKK